MANVYVEVRGPYLLEGKELLEPGSVIGLDEDTAREMVRRKMGKLHPGPTFRAPSKGPHGLKWDGTPIVERPWPAARQPEDQTIGAKLADAERAVAPPQGRMQQPPRAAGAV